MAAIFGASLLIHNGTARADGPTRDRIAVCATRIVRPEDWRLEPGQLWDLALRDRISNGALLYLGVEHSRPPGDDEYSRIADRFADFAPDIVFYEGDACPSCTLMGSEAAEARDGEPGLVQSLAAKRHVAAHTLEPEQGELLATLARRFDPVQVELFQVLRYAANLRDRFHLNAVVVKSRTEGFIATLRNRATDAGTTLPVNDLAGIASAYSAMWPGHDWEEARLDWFSPLAAPARASAPERLFHRINAVETTLRNEVMYRKLANATLAGHRVFAVVGRNHVPLQAPALRCAIVESPFDPGSDPSGDRPI